MFIPWQGEGYSTRRLLILGESAYGWEDDDGVCHEPQSDHSSFIVRTIVEDFDAMRANIPFMTKITRALVEAEDPVWPTLEQRRAAWNNVAFMNYIETSVGFGPRVRPSATQWQAAAEGFRARLAAFDPPPRYVLVLGLTLWNNMPETDQRIDAFTQAYRLETGELVWCRALRHPSAGGVGTGWRDIRDAVSALEKLGE